MLFKAIVILNFLSVVAGFVFWVLESKRRRTAEDTIFHELSQMLNNSKEDLDLAHKRERACDFLYKRSNLHYDLIKIIGKRLDKLEGVDVE